MFGIFKRKSWVCDLSKGVDNAEQSLRSHGGSNAEIADNLNKLAHECFNIAPQQAINFMRESMSLVPSISKQKWIAFRLFDLGKIDESYALIMCIPNNEMKTKSEISRRAQIVAIYDQNKKERVQATNKLANNSKNQKNASKVTESKNTKVINNNENKNTVNTNTLKENHLLYDFKNRLSNINIEESNRYFKKLDLKIGIICDEIYWESIESAAYFKYLLPTDLYKIDNTYDLLLVVSPWKGIKNEWYGVGSIDDQNNLLRKNLIEIIEKFKNLRIPTVFISKEDPPNYKHFVDFAKHCDYIFSSAIECVEKYKVDCDNPNVHVLCFGINPKYHNPIGTSFDGKPNDLIFAGSWMNKYPDRCRILSEMFEGVITSKYQLNTIDRNYPKYKNTYPWPSRYIKYNSPAINHADLQKIHKLVDWGINVNSVTSSCTMFANRCYELSAMGLNLLSNYSLGMSLKHPLISIVYDQNETKNILDKTSSFDLKERKTFLIREQYDNNTCFDRLAQILDVVGIEYKITTLKVLVVLDEENESNISSFSRQTYQSKAYISYDQLTIDKIKEFDLITWFSSDYFYEEFYLEDLINGFKYSSCDFISKSIENGGEYKYVNNFSNKYSTVFWIKTCPFELIFNKNCSNIDDFNGNGLVIDTFNLKYSKFDRARSISHKFAVIIPINNNAVTFYGKAFSSLKHLSNFNELDLHVLINRSTNDLRNNSIINYIERNYPNVVIHENASLNNLNNLLNEIDAKVITILQPENEVINDVYEHAYKEINENNADLICFNSRLLFRSVSYRKFNAYFKEQQFSNNIKKALTLSKYQFPSIAECIFKKDTLYKLNLIDNFSDLTIFKFFVSNETNSKDLKFSFLPFIGLNIFSYTNIFRANANDLQINNIIQNQFSFVELYKNLNIDKQYFYELSPNSGFLTFFNWLIESNISIDLLKDFEAFCNQNIDLFHPLFKKSIQGILLFIGKVIAQGTIELWNKEKSRFRFLFSHEQINLFDKLSVDQDLKLSNERGFVEGKATIKKSHVYYDLKDLDQCFINHKALYAISYNGALDLSILIEYYNREHIKISQEFIKNNFKVLDFKKAYSSRAFKLRVAGQGEFDNLKVDCLHATYLLIDQVVENVSLDVLVAKVLKAKKYISIKRNQIVSKLPENDFTYIDCINRYLLLNELKTIVVNFEYSGNCEALLFVKFISDLNQQVEVKSISAGDSFIQIPDDACYLELLLRLKGKGELKNVKVSITPSTKEIMELKEAQYSSSYSTQTQNEISKLKVACIMDEFTWNSYSPEANFLQLKPQEWKEQIDDFKPDFLFVESAWKGIDDLWVRKISNFSDELKELLQYCKQNKIKTAFWNKEDPIHFGVFLNTALNFDYIFTYDFNCVEKYKSYTKRNNVFFLPMAAQLRLHNPIENFERKDGICFAGSYYLRYPERTKDLDDFIKYLPKFKNVDIYDRQFGKDDPNYMFPEQYKPYIKGYLPYEKMDQAYKGYKYAINLNSIKQAQSVARRVFELLASNTFIISNFSRGVSTLFGDLLEITDSGANALRKLNKFESQEAQDQLIFEKIKYHGLRKILEENTYEDRFAYIVEKILDLKRSTRKVFENEIYVLTDAKTPSDLIYVYRLFKQQNYKYKKLVLLNFELISSQSNPSERELNKIINDSEVLISNINESNNNFKFWLENACTKNNNLQITLFSKNDYYAENYLTDLIEASRYAIFTDVQAISKGNNFMVSNKKTLKRNQSNTNYNIGQKFNLAQGLISCVNLANAIKEKRLVNIIDLDYTYSIPTLYIDSFNYCNNFNKLALSQDRKEQYLKLINSNVEDLNIGKNCTELQKIAEEIDPLNLKVSVTKNKGIALVELHKLLTETAIEQADKITVSELGSENKFKIISTLDANEVVYLKIPKIFKLAEIIEPNDQNIKLNLSTEQGMKIGLAVYFLDQAKHKISAKIFNPNTNITFPYPKGTRFIQFYFRIFVAGEVTITSLNFEHLNFEPSLIFDESECIVLTNNYPAYDDLYKYAFVHTRVREYINNGLRCTIFLPRDGTVMFREFENVNVIEGTSSTFEKLVQQSKKLRFVVVHFLTEKTLELLRMLPKGVNVYIWSHGSDIFKVHRRLYNFTTPEELEHATKMSEKRTKFWQPILDNVPKNFHYIFVSHFLYDVVCEDYGINIPEDHYSIINNPINRNIFAYHKKDFSQRCKILSIRSFETRMYANDITVSVILELSKRDIFEKLEFMIIGDGSLFEETVAPILNFPNVKVEQKFLNHYEIAEIHKEYGIFLCPTRYDTQGVSRDEAMASGLVPVTYRIAAVPEFVDESCAILGDGEDPIALADGIEMLYKEPDLFLQMSEAAAKNVANRDLNVIISKELNLFSIKMLNRT